MTLSPLQVELDRLDARLRILLPEQYQDDYQSVEPTSMGSAGLKFDADGNVAWDAIWQTFCDLAMAGGPPHKGTLLEPGDPSAINADPDGYERVVNEICRGIGLAADLPTTREVQPGWVQVHCYSATMADWLARAIVMENVSARSVGLMLYLPAGPQFRIDKEIKNVVTVIAKTTHYWTGHMSRSQKALIADLFQRMAEESPLIELMAHGRTQWDGTNAGSVKRAVWIMRALAAFNVMARREGTTVFVPRNTVADPLSAIAGAAVAAVTRLADAADIR